ncbi:MAG: PEGA domain-containing protein, partial [Myxococcales bacterium]|nr:PEGA domain-containing protein [Myxococcales bacterium]
AKERAKALFVEGRGHFAAGRLAQALAAFEQANAIKPHPLMLYNIAQVYEAMEDLPRAIDTMRKFVASDAAEADAKTKLASLEQTLTTWPEVSLTTQPAGAAVRVGGPDMSVRCTTPCTVRLPPGKRNLLFTLTNYQPVERPVRFNAGQRLTFPPVALPPVLASVTFQTSPPGAQVIVDGQSTPGSAPFTQALPVGTHTARISLPGHKPTSRSFTLTPTHTAAAPLTVQVALERGQANGLLAITVDRPGAQIMVDEKLVGIAPLPGPIDVEGGLHRLRIKAEGADAHEEVVTVKPGQTTETFIELSVGGPSVGLSQRTVGYGLMGLGGAALIGAAVTGALASGANGDLEDCRADLACGRTEQEVDLADDVKGKALTTDILLGAGVAIAATGVVLWLLDDGPAEGANAETARSRASGPSWVILPTTDGGLSAGASFRFQ